MILTGFERRLRIIEAHYGRDSGWFLEHLGRRVAQLTDSRVEDMFWDSYAIELLTDVPAERYALLHSATHWLTSGFVYRSREFGDVVKGAIPAFLPFPEPGRVLMRGLYLEIDAPSLWERLVLWARGE